MKPDDFPDQKFLLVDDSPDHLEMLCHCLTTIGFAFEEAADGHEAMEILKLRHFDIVISDIQMPRADGMQLLRFIKETHPQTDVILMTGYSKDYTFTDVIRAGATDYLEKPFTRDAVRAKIFRILKERKLLAEYHQELTRRRQTEVDLQRKSDELEKRGRELNCLYRISNIMEEKRERLAEIFQETVNILPQALQHQELAMARLHYGGGDYASPGFHETPWRLAAAILSKGSEVGTIEVCYARIGADGAAAFQEEERSLLNEVAAKLGRAIDARLAEEELGKYFTTLEDVVKLRTMELRSTQTAMESVFQNIPDGILSVDESMIVSHVNDRCRPSLEVQVGQVFSGGSSQFQAECASVLKNSLSSREAVTDYRIEIRNGEQVGQVFLVSTSLLEGATGQITGALLILHDITRLADLESQLMERRRFRQMVGRCFQLQEIYDKVRKLASVDTTVLITGESGTGKEILVETLHSSGNRSAKPLIRVNCAALPENLLESELFGHVRGAFTGAVRDRAGRIQAAEGGILFLDEIGDISPRIQLKLLRFLEVKEYERVGETVTRQADVRVFAATNADLARKVQEGLFREDLYYRLKVMIIHLPPLRERREDIPFLVDHFLGSFNKRFHKSITGISKEALDMLMNCDWPGNIRELKHAVEHAVILATGSQLEVDHLPKDLLAETSKSPAQDGQPARIVTRADVLGALRQTDGNKAKTARLLRLSRTTLYTKMREFGLTDT